MRLAVLLMLGLAACDDTVRVRLTAGADPLMQQECNLAARASKSFWVELVRPYEQRANCRDLPASPGRATSLLQLEQVLGRLFFFDEVVEEGRWVLWVEGFVSRDCDNAGSAPLLCGVSRGASLPEGGDALEIPISCAAGNIAWTAEALENCIKK